MTEERQRITVLETNMAYVLSILAKREEYQSSVLKSLTIIELKQDQTLSYQKTCDIERSAHSTRLYAVENDQTLQNGYRKMIRAQAGGIAAFAAFFVSAITVVTMMRGH